MADDRLWWWRSFQLEFHRSFIILRCFIFVFVNSSIFLQFCEYLPLQGRSLSKISMKNLIKNEIGGLTHSLQSQPSSRVTPVKSSYLSWFEFNRFTLSPLNVTTQTSVVEQHFHLNHVASFLLSFENEYRFQSWTWKLLPVLKGLTCLANDSTHR